MTGGEVTLFAQAVLPSGVALITKLEPEDHWPKHIAISDELLDLADPEFLTSGDGMVRFTMANGDTALYGVAHGCDVPRCHHYDLLGDG